MRRALSVGLYIVAGFFLYVVSIVAFAQAPSPGLKWFLVLIFSIPGVVALLIGCAIGRFHNWTRDVGVVLLCAAGFTAFLIFTFVCLLMTEQFRRMMPPDVLAFFSDYATGGAVLAGFAIVGALLLKAGSRSADA